jgi:hypothetical protein
VTDNAIVGKYVTILLWTFWLRLRLWYLTSLSTIFQLLSWRSVSLVEETGVPEKKPPTCRKSLTSFIKYNCIEYTSPWAGFELTTLVVIGADCICSCKSNYHTIWITKHVVLTV